jgi:hypothetical protein
MNEFEIVIQMRIDENLALLARIRFKTKNIYLA